MGTRGSTTERLKPRVCPYPHNSKIAGDNAVPK